MLCRIEEYAGGFDGYWHTRAADKKHEPGIKEAVRQLLGVSDSTAGNQRALAIVCDMLAFLSVSCAVYLTEEGILGLRPHLGADV